MGVRGEVHDCCTNGNKEAMSNFESSASLKFSQFNMEFHRMDLDLQDFSSHVSGIAVQLYT